VRPGYVHRFSKTERTVHWVNALGFFFLLATGLILYIPRLSIEVGRRQFIQEIHFWGGVGWVSSLLIVAVLGDRRGLLRTAREIDVFAPEDVNWLTLRVPNEQPRFNAGQKLNAALTAAFMVLFLVSGLLLWFGEQDTRFRFASTVILHDGLLYVSLALLLGHLYLSLIHPTTRHALRGMVLGNVREDWAREHHARWKTNDGRP
jgi:formate dehydrogenase subunit gamma